MKKTFFLFGFFFFAISFSFAQSNKIRFDSHKANTRYADSMKRVDSLHVDSVNKANQFKTRKKSGKKPKTFHSVAAILKPKDVVSFQ